MELWPSSAKVVSEGAGDPLRSRENSGHGGVGMIHSHTLGSFGRTDGVGDVFSELRTWWGGCLFELPHTGCLISSNGA